MRKILAILMVLGVMLWNGCGKQEEDKGKDVDLTQEEVSDDSGDETAGEDMTTENIESEPGEDDGKININTATADELAEVKGVASKGAAIVKYREENGPFKSIDELDNVSGFGKATIDKVREYLTVGKVEGGDDEAAGDEESADDAGKVNINAATAEDLVAMKIPRLGPSLAEKIVAYREANGPFASMADVDKVPMVGEAMMTAMEGKFSFGKGGTAKSTATPAATGDEHPTSATSSSKTKPAVAAGSIDLNKATKEQLMTVKGVGEATANAIIAGRPYKTVEDLKKVKGLGGVKGEAMMPFFTVK